MKKIILGLALATLAGACSPLVHPAVQQERLQEQQAKQRLQQQQQAPTVQTAQPAGDGATHQP